MSADHAVDLIDRDRREIANAGIGVAIRLARQARTYAANARRYGRDPVDAANAVFLGDYRTTHANAIDVLTQTMVVSNLRGRRRSITNAVAQIGPIRLDRNQDKLDDREQALLLLLLLTNEELGLLYVQYGPIAERLLNDATVALVEQIDASAAAQEIRNAFDSAGFSPNDPSAIQNIFVTAGVLGYEQGRFSGWEIPQIRESLWGFRYSAILDTRTTALCRSLNDMRAPKDDPIWKSLSPPNHFYCRSTLIEQFESSELNEPTSQQPDATAEQLADFLREKRRFQSYL